MKKIAMVPVALILGIGLSFAQVRDIPKSVQETFTKQYPSASDVEYKDQLVRVDVSFNQDGAHMLASYNNKGVWKETWKDFTFDELNPEIRDGFSKSKYADRKVDEVTVIYLPGGKTEYRLRATKNDVQKNYLYFNEKGRLVRTSVTI